MARPAPVAVTSVLLLGPIGGGEVDLVIRKSGCRLAFCVGVFLVRGCSVGICPLGGADSSLETREGRCESCLNLAATASRSCTCSSSCEPGPPLYGPRVGQGPRARSAASPRLRLLRAAAAGQVRGQGHTTPVIELEAMCTGHPSAFKFEETRNIKIHSKFHSWKANSGLASR